MWFIGLPERSKAVFIDAVRERMCERIASYKLSR